MSLLEKIKNAFSPSEESEDLEKLAKIEHLTWKINNNKDLIEIYENKIKKYSAEKIEQDKPGAPFYMDYDKGIQDAEYQIRLLKKEIEEWEEEIRSGNFKGFY
ncbi:TPA: hypothetical protein VB825_002100 [Streptococcus suis]|nr:hypothetical protein [Streptococcus suis]